MRSAGARLLMLLTVSAGCRDGCAGWNDAFERMVNQPKYNSYAPSEFYTDGRAMQPPPDETIPRESFLGDPKLTDGLDGKDYVKNFPVQLSLALLRRGRNRFDIYCAPCHGVLGDGDTPVADKMQLRKPPSLREERLIGLVPGQIYHVVHEGYGLMPAYDGQLSLNDRWAVVAYVKALQLSRAVPIVALPASFQEEARRVLR